MSQTNACPSAEMLQNLLMGKVPGERLAELSSHLEACSACQERAGTLAGHDTLLDAARGDTRRTEEIVRKVPRELWAKLKFLPGSLPVERRDEPTESWQSQVDTPEPCPEPTPEDRNLLAPAEQPDEIGRLGPYRVLRVLGRGGMGVVFLAHDPRLDRQVALKAMLPGTATRPEAKKRFLREARAAAAVSSVYIAHIYDVGEDRGVLYLAMEYLEGWPLDKYLAGGRRLTVPEALRIGRDVAGGLAAAHEKGLIHRDIKPANIWLDRNSGHGKILDFGLARMQKDDAHLTQSGTIVGTPAYMAPEQARGESVDARSDLFSLGVVLYRLCTGELPFKGDETMHVLLALALDSPKPPSEINPEIPSQLSEFILQLLSKAPGDRPASAKEVVAWLQLIERHLSPAPEPPAPVQGETQRTRIEKSLLPPRPRKRSYLGIMLAAAVLGLLLPLGWWLAGVLLRVETPEGTLVINSDDPDVEVVVKKDGVVLFDRLRDREVRLKVGDYAIELVEPKAGLKLSTDKFAITRDGKETVRVFVEKPPVAAVVPPVKEPPPEKTAPEKPLPEKVGNITVHPTTPLLKGHTDGVRGVAFLPDSKHAVSIAWDGKALLWDVTTGKLVRNLLAEDNKDKILNVVAVSPDGKLAAVGGSAGYVHFCALDKEGKPRAGRLESKAYSIHGLVFTKDSKRLLVGVGEEVIVFDATSGTRLTGFSAAGAGIVLRNDKEAVGISKETIGTWDIADGIGGVTFPRKTVSSLAVFPDGEHVVSGGLDGTLEVSLLDGKRPGRSWRAHKGRIYTVAILHGGRWVLSAGDDRFVRIWEAGERSARGWDGPGHREIYHVGTEKHVTQTAAVSPDGKWLLTGGGWHLVDRTYYENDYDLRLWLLPEPDKK